MLSIDEKNRELNGWNILVEKANKTQNKAKIQVFASCNIN